MIEFLFGLALVCAGLYMLACAAACLLFLVLAMVGIVREVRGDRG